MQHGQPYLRSNQFCFCHFGRQTRPETVRQFQRTAAKALRTQCKHSTMLEVNSHPETFQMNKTEGTKQLHSKVLPSLESPAASSVGAEYTETRDCHINI